MPRSGKAPVLQPEEEKPLPEPRPGTSGTTGTELLLISNRRQASNNFQKAQRAEKAYRTKKRAGVARKDYQGAKDHSKESLRHLKIALKMSFGLVKSAPYIYGEKREERRREGDQKKKAKAMEKRKKLEERLAREADEAEPEDDAAETTREDPKA